jgi:hypothetical protein
MMKSKHVSVDTEFIETVHDPDAGVFANRNALLLPVAKFIKNRIFWTPYKPWLFSPPDEELSKNGDINNGSYTTNLTVAVKMDVPPTACAALSATTDI